MRFSQYHFTRMWAGGDGLPKHLFCSCPHMKRMLKGATQAPAYRLSDNSQTLQLIRCKWCRNKYLTMMMLDPEVPDELVRGLALKPLATVGS